MDNNSLGEVCSQEAAKEPIPITLKGQKVTVVPMDADKYAKDLHEGTALPQNGYLFHYMWDEPRMDFSDYKQWLTQKNKRSDIVMFAILDNKTGKAVGNCQYMRIDAPNRTMEVGGIIYSPTFQRTFGSTEAMYLLAKHAFDDLGYRRYQWTCNSNNKPSWNAALRLGFTFEGVLRNNLIVKGHNRDDAYFSILDKEWPVVKQAMEQWLSHDNFDDQGHQKQSLSAIREKIQSEN